MTMETCNMVVFSDKAYNAIIRESFAKHPVETGGILLGHILDNGMWIVMEMVPPGINSVHEIAFFEYDQDFVNYLGTSIANQYQTPLTVLGLWHRHPGSMDYFSSTDDVTNSDFASRNPYGVISGLINIDPKLRLTMYHLTHTQNTRPQNVAYSKVDFEVGDDLIPEEYFALRYLDVEKRELNPQPSVSKQASIITPRANTKQEKSEEVDCPDKEDNGKKNISMIDRISQNKRIVMLFVAILCASVLFAGGFYCGKRSNMKEIDKPQQTESTTTNSETND